MKESNSARMILDKRKKDHIHLALQSRVSAALADHRFFYEPILKGHPVQGNTSVFEIAGKRLNHPIWVSSMTGGTAAAATINKRLARACKEFGLGMGLGSCRIILDQQQYFKDFDIRKSIGDASPLFANLGIAQIELIHREDSWGKVMKMINKLNADGLIIHINPLQEWFQPEGDHIHVAPLDSIKQAIKALPVPIIVKEVGQGMGKESLKALMKLPLEAIEFAAFGGTNFSILELKRDPMSGNNLNPLIQVGHTADDMVEMVNALITGLGNKVKCKRYIISGGINNFLDGYYLVNKLKLPSVYGQASALLTPARKGYPQLSEFVQSQIEGLQLAYNYLTVR